MRKWMRERLTRRKKTDPAKAGEPVPPPLQPAYFETAPPEDLPAQAMDKEVKAEVEAPEQAEPESQPASEPAARSATTDSRGRTRRRGRGGRGRGGRAREQGATPASRPSSESIPSESQPETQRTSAAKAPSGAPAAAPKGVVVLAIGLPGSGKSSWFKRHNVAPLSSDMLRALLFDDPSEQRFQDLVFSNLRSMLKARLVARRPMNYVDATNLTPSERSNWIKLAKDYGYEAHAVFFDVPLEVCIERHQRRDRVVPEDLMRRMAAKLKPPTFEEGFAKITVVRVKKKDAE